jgi:hypothetical protein
MVGTHCGLVFIFVCLICLINHCLIFVEFQIGVWISAFEWIKQESYVWNFIAGLSEKWDYNGR